MKLLALVSVPPLILSEKSEQAALEGLKVALKDSTEQLETLDLESDFGKMRALELLRRYESLSLRFSDSLSPLELQELAAQFGEEAKETMSISLRMKIKNLGSRSYSEIKEWIKNSNLSRGRAYDVALRSEEEEAELYIWRKHGAHPLLKFNTIGLAVGAALYSVNFAVGISPTELDQYLLWGFATHVREHSDLISKIAAAMAVGPFIPHLIGYVVQRFKKPPEEESEPAPEGTARALSRSWTFKKLSGSCSALLR